MDDRKSRFVEATNRPGGWPRISAQVLAAALHLALLGLIVSTWRAIPQRAGERPVKVALVLAPPPKPAVAAPKPRLVPPPPSLAPPSEPRTDSSALPAARAPKAGSSLTPSSAKAERQSRPNPPPPRAKPLKAERPPPDRKPGRPTVTAHVEPGVAIYSVTIEKAGAIGAISLLQSSGRPEFDAAGEQMIRRSMTFHPPPGAGDRTRYFSVTIRFTPNPP